MTARLECDVAVIGAGVAGLWAWRRLRARGVNALLISAGPIGAGQTLASQGIIHGGVKYALTGEASRASAMIAGMPGVWRACLRGEPGEGDPDLSGARVLAQEQFLWTTRGIVSRLGGVAASKALRTDVERVGREERPAAFRDAPGEIDLYRVEEQVVEPASLVRALAGDGEGIVCAAGAARLIGAPGGSGVVESAACAMAGGEEIEIRARVYVCAAGAGNETLIAQAGASDVKTQRRPLHMVMARGELPLIYGHCVTASATPRATITSQRDAGGRVVWWIGGAIAESGVGRSREEQVAHAMDEVAACLPWIGLQGVEWATMRIDRAEGLPEGRSPGARPDEPVVRAAGNVVFAWPTKLAFAPMLAGMVEREVARMGVGRAGAAESMVGDPLACARGSLGQGAIGALPWEDVGVRWS